MCYIKKIFLKVLYGKKFVIGSGVTWRHRFNLLIENDGYVKIGNRCFFNNDCSISSNYKVVIGDECLFGENVKIYDHNHRFANPNLSIKDQGFSNGEVKIGNHCWVCSNVVILKGASIGDNCVIGAGCVISGIVSDNKIVKQGDDYTIENIIAKDSGKLWETNNEKNKN